MELRIKTEFTITLTPKELGLVSRALRTSLKPEEVEDANDLQERMMESKVTQMRRALEEISKLDFNLKQGG